MYFFSRHQQLTKLLNRYINEPLHHNPRESNGEYYSLVLIIHLQLKTSMLRLSEDFLTHNCMFVSFLTSFVLLDTVVSNADWSCHPANSSHVGRLWGANLWFALPLAGQKHLHTVPPHDHIPKV